MLKLSQAVNYNTRQKTIRKIITGLSYKYEWKQMLKLSPAVNYNTTTNKTYTNVYSKS
jgi:hypothetical protein